MNKNKSEEAFNELVFYTLSLQDASFIHQHVVDAYGVQTADSETKPIRVVFSLIGLYLYLEKNYTGKQVQHFHMLMSKNKIQWPKILLPEKRGDITVSNVLAAAPGLERDKMIKRWCEEVWESYKKNRPSIMALVKQYETKSEI